jgi:DNA polymerase I-like protein with 3'-5' exonuclease and polymerase domains
VRRWGWQTHHIQLRAAIVLDAITANGMGIDLEQRGTLQQQLQAVADEQLEVLRAYGYLPGQKGSGKALQGILKRLQAQHRDLEFPRTATGKYSTSQESLTQLAPHEFVTALLEFQEVQKLQSAFVAKMGKQRLHPSFDVLKTTGRTSSFGEINAQNLPVDKRVRSCFCPSEGQAFVNADYSTIEMATLAQSLRRQFRLESRMLQAINNGKDLHRLVAARVAGKPESQVTIDEREKAKPINFGKPGGMGSATLRTYARASYKVDLTEDEVERLSDSWFDLFPEMEAFLTDGGDLGLEVACLFHLTPSAHFEHTGSPRFVDHPNNIGRGDLPHPILGKMCLKVLKTAEPRKTDGRPYSSEDIDFFWHHVARNIECLPTRQHHPIQHRRPSLALQRAVMRVVGRAPVFTLTGRLRANASYCARHNTVFQGLAADGAKLGLWNLWRAGYRIVNFIHDEVLVEVPSGPRLAFHAETIRHLMIQGMRAVVPDVRINVEYAVTDRWYKKAPLSLTQDGRLGVFSQEANDN